jgi:hypothetical protein
MVVSVRRALFCPKMLTATQRNDRGNPKKRTKNSSIYDIPRCIDRFRERRMDGRFVADGESLFPIYENMRMEDESYYTIYENMNKRKYR